MARKSIFVTRLRAALVAIVIVTGASWSCAEPPNPQVPGSASAGRRPQDTANSWGGRGHRPRAKRSTPGACDLLFADQSSLAPVSSAAATTERTSDSDAARRRSENRLSTWCECKDSLLAGSNELEGLPNEQLPAGSTNPISINHLVCSHHNLADLVDQVALRLLEPDGLTFQIDYLGVSVNWTTTERELRLEELPSARRLHVSQVSFTWAAPSGAKPAASAQEATKQMSLFIGALLDSGYLQSLAVNYERHRSLGAREQVVVLDELLRPLHSLNRLEMSFRSADQDSESGPDSDGLDKLRIFINKETFVNKTKLKWLNLGSNDRVSFQANERASLGQLVQLQYLNLESSNLAAFPLLKLVALEFHSAGVKFVGHPELASLSLARNKLRVLSEHLFESADSIGSPQETCLLRARSGSELDIKFDHQSGQARTPYQLPSLSVLDLSFNQIETLTLAESESLLCLMPHLAHLHLQHNSITSLNLNSLLSFDPNRLISSVPESNDAGSDDPLIKQQNVLSSNLEFVDLSHNELVQISAIRGLDYSNRSKVALKSINLNQNRLQEPVLSLDGGLVNKVIFKETLEMGTDALLFNLNFLHEHLSFSKTTEGSEVQYGHSICDFLSANPKKSEVVGPGQEQTGLNELLLSGNGMCKIARHYFDSVYCSGLEVLHLRGNKIQVIESNSLDRLERLIELDLSDNLLTSVESNFTNSNSSLFSKLVKLTHLSLANNKLKQFKQRSTFANLVELQLLNLSGNQLFYLSREVFFNNYPQLARIDLSSNKFTHLDAGTFSHLKHLTELDLSDNKLKDINLFQLLAPLRTHQMITNAATNPRARQESAPIMRRKPAAGNKRADHDNKLRFKQQIQRPLRRQSRHLLSSGANSGSIDAMDSFIEPISSLKLSSNKLASFRIDDNNTSHCDSLHSIKDIQLLELAGNLLREIDESTFRCFSRLEKIDLHGNQLKMLDLSAFRHMEYLEHLSLANNRLLRLRSQRALSHLSALRFLDLSANQLVQFDLAWHFNSSATVPLEHLDLSDNPSLKLNLNEVLGLLKDEQVPLSSLKLNRIASIARPPNTILSEPNEANSSGSKQLVTLELNAIQKDIDPCLFEHSNIVLARLELTASKLGILKDKKIETFLRNQLMQELHEQPISLILNNNNLTLDDLPTLWTFNRSQVVETRVLELDLSFNQIDGWPFTSNSSRFSRLKSLDLSGNRLKYFIQGDDIERDYNLLQLELLNLSSNALIGLLEYSTVQRTVKKLSDLSTFARLIPKLKSIDLSHNRLTWLPANIFDHFEQLREIIVRHNFLESFPLSSALITRGIKVDLQFNSKLRFVDQPPQTQTTSEMESSLALDDRLTLYQDGETGSFQCELLDEYVRGSAQRKPVDELGRGCGQTLEFASMLRLSSVSRQFHLMSLAQLGPQIAGRPLLVSLSRNELANLTIGRKQISSNSLVQLDLSHNSLVTMPDEFCNNFGSLLSLNLRNNRFTRMPWNLPLACARLRHLNLGYNEISELPAIDAIESGAQDLAVLRLNNNELKLISSTLQHSVSKHFPKLRLLDLRANPKLKSLESHEFRLRHWQVVKPRTRIWWTETDQSSEEFAKIRLEVTSKELTLNLGTASFPLRLERRIHESIDVSANSVNSSLATVRLESSRSHSIRYCTLINSDRNAGNVWSVCVEQKEEFCLPLRLPRGPSCLTDLDGLERASQQLSQKSTTLVERKATGEEGESGDDDRPTELLQPADAHRVGPKQDFVLNIIDQAKLGWLSLKQLDLNKKLAAMTNLRNDSVLLTIDVNGARPIPIYSLTVLKLGICLASICIVLLLAAMFSLLHSAAKRRVRSRKVGDASRIQQAPSDEQIGHGSSCDDTINSDSRRSDSTMLNATQSSNSQTISATTCSSSNSHRPSNSSTTTSSKASTSDQEAQQTTVLERRPTGRLETIQAPFEGVLAQLSNNSCLTPSSSLAPSSVGTTETMQAVDSIQSSSTVHQAANGMASFAGASVDQYSSLAANQADLSPIRELPPPPPVATVLRMIKSSSFSSQPAPSLPGAGGTLRSRMQTIHERARWRQQQQQPVYVPHSMSSYGGQAYTLGDRFEDPLVQPSTGRLQLQQQHLSELDPATLSLLSINSALSSTMGQGAELDPRENPRENQANLCHYHQIALQQQQQQQFAFQGPRQDSLRRDPHELNFDDLIPPPPPPVD